MGPTDEQELTRLLNALGLEVQTLPCYRHPNRMHEAAYAALSVSTCPTHDDYLVKVLQERYGVPYLLKNMPIGRRATSDWLRDIAAFFNLQDEADAIIAKEEAELNAALAPFLERFKGKKAMLSAGEVRVLSTAVYLKELGMEIVAVRPYHFDEFGEHALSSLAESQPDVLVNVATVHPFESVNIIEKTKPDIYLGHSSDNVWAAKSGVSVLPVYHSGYTYIGYAGAFDIARRIDKVLGNPAFNRNLAERVKQPYFASWLKEDPFAFITEE
jgi:nitrogenase molybdenum-iron protein alpha chain